MNAVWFACEQITSASKHDSSTCESSLLTRRLTFGQLAEFTSCYLFGRYSILLVPSTKIIFRTQIFNFFVCFWVCFVFVCFFGLPLVWFRVIWSVGPCVVHFCPSWWSAWHHKTEEKLYGLKLSFSTRHAYFLLLKQPQLQGKALSASENLLWTFLLIHI